MGLGELFYISIALSLDAFSVALSCGIRLPADRYRKFLKIALAFGIFQAAMPLLGSVLSKYLLAKYIVQYAPLISSLVFGGLGAKTFLVAGATGSHAGVAAIDERTGYATTHGPWRHGDRIGFRPVTP